VIDDDLSNGVNVIRIRPIDDSVGAGLNLASYIDEAVRLGFSGYLDRKRQVKSPSSRANPRASDSTQ